MPKYTYGAYGNVAAAPEIHIVGDYVVAFDA
jgi:hypothetical protein